MAGHLSDSELQRWLDSELGPAGRRRVDHHLGGCAQCRARRDELAWLYQNLMDDAGAVEADAPEMPDMLASIMDSVADEPAPKRREGRVVVGWVVFAIAVLGIGIFAVSTGGATAWEAWFVDVSGQLTKLVQATGGLWTALRAGLPTLAPVIAAIVVMCAAGLVVTTRMALAISRRKRKDDRAVERIQK